MADSFYEYLLKVWILNGSKDEGLRRHFDKAANVRMRLVEIK